MYTNKSYHRYDKYVKCIQTSHIIDTIQIRFLLRLVTWYSFYDSGSQKENQLLQSKKYNIYFHQSPDETVNNQVRKIQNYAA